MGEAMFPAHSIDIHQSWYHELWEEFNQQYFKDLKAFILSEKAKGKLVLPAGNEIFAAFNSTPFEKVKVVLLGQDPYHGKGQAHGLCFSVNKGTKLPPSLQNIYKEMEADIALSPPKHGYLQRWASQGILMLNSILTVNENEPGSHRDKGWELFTDKVISTISDKKEHVVFILWGKFAQSKIHLIDQKKHKILSSAHPSPFSAHNGFFGSRPFSATNQYFVEKGLPPIDWQLPL